jgi:dihydrofolate synthase/folylpolyglutamate synthase
MAFDYFAKQNTDIAIIETGLGGRLDATNIITPLLSIITNISFDHMDILGNNIKEIAFEKAGIIKPKIPIVIGEYTNETKPVFEKMAFECQAPITFAENTFLTKRSFINTSGKQEFNILNLKTNIENTMTSDLLGIYQQKNISTMLTCFDVLNQTGVSIAPESITNGLNSVMATTGLMGRWQILQQNPLIIADTGHNQGGISYTMNQLKKISHHNLHIVIGMVNDKDPDLVLTLLPTEAKYYFTKANIPRALNETDLHTYAQKYGLKGQCFESVHLALKEAIKNAKSDDVVYIGGSNFIVGEALPLFS